MTFSAFRSRRGRPRTSQRRWRDTGTPELVAKRALGLTVEALDQCLARGILTSEQHWCGVHLRWLYTLRFGAPGVRAVDPAHFGGMELRPERPEWRAAREAEYLDALRLLGRHGPALLSLAIHNISPKCLRPPGDMAQARRWALHAGAERDDLLAGFERLVRLWCRRQDPHKENVNETAP